MAKITKNEMLRNRREIDGFADAYPYAAVASPDVTAPQFENFSVSRVTAPDTRTWRFKTADARDAFVLATPTAETAGNN